MPAIFVISCMNFTGFSGIQMNCEAYSAYPEEREILIADGFDCYILQVIISYTINT